VKFLQAFVSQRATMESDHAAGDPRTEQDAVLAFDSRGDGMELRDEAEGERGSGE